MKIVKNIECDLSRIKAGTVFLPIEFSRRDIDKLKGVDLSKYCITIEPKEVKRSLQANAYSWVLCDLIAKAVGSDRDTIHEEMLFKYGVFSTYSIRTDAFDSAVRAFDYYKILGKSELNGFEYTHVRAVVGSHKYNSVEMSHFIDGIVREAKDLDIETIPQKEIDRMCKECGIKNV